MTFLPLSPKRPSQQRPDFIASILAGALRAFYPVCGAKHIQRCQANRLLHLLETSLTSAL